jgi:hypothetical protein
LLNANQYTLLLSAFPVQLAALLMTCVRKGIMTAKGWHLWYAASFVGALSSITNAFDLVVNLAYGALLYAIRHRGRIDKYVIWAVLSATLPFVIDAPSVNPFTADAGVIASGLKSAVNHS